ncbi:hypothetical protein VF04_03825 [Nostoc linckia z7]|uniref:Helix-turn-helix domain-containing protein n=2 Tax=Nostoc linckia TaxID=92942 RepID=A0A9Q5ZFY1_NOSLI|nr:helix-turn-helix domain-containing protein [Nostoc linckia]PHK42986.1 hypothetical protein VF12_01290 [Nostoc linckia z15]PHK48143.1 hypothetical protein VF13_02265 [Nostoc linckia z16]PHJ64927.1 hypothetical protein VF02_11315 [Nostoc linckia z1]PHJ70104.1 hypothetical protein VF05_11470 [Nostoc linckia z3]PHJ75005.1 hypothetical protein VF03_11630 [Nostoc linckia z2]
MNIFYASQYLGVSIKTIERAVRRNEIAVTKIDGKRDFSEEELRRYKEEKAQPIHHPAIVKTGSDIELSHSVAPEYIEAISEYFHEGVAHVEVISRYFELMHIGSQLTIGVKQAAQISGFSKNFILSNLKSGKLQGKKIGKGWRIRPKDLNEFVDMIFNSNE